MRDVQQTTAGCIPDDTEQERPADVRPKMRASFGKAQYPKADKKAAEPAARNRPAANAAALKPKTCKACRAKFTPARPFQTWCSPDCALSILKAKQDKQVKEKARQERHADKAKRDRLKSRSDWAKEAQAAFNAYIRARDADLPCISCGRHHTGQWHAGHYLSRGARPELAMHEDNCHKQCAPCNTHLSGNLVLYRVNLIERIGLERVQWLEGPHETAKLSTQDLIAIRDEYRAKKKAIEGGER